jgi:hypothetical protein
MIAVHGASLPWGRLDTDGVTVAPALCLTCSRPCRPSLGPSGWPIWRTGPGYAFALPPNPGPATANWTDRPGVTYRSLIAASPQLRQAWPVCRGHGQALLRMAGSRRRCLSLTHAPTSCELGRIHRPARLTAVSRGIPEGAASAGIALRWEVVRSRSYRSSKQPIGRRPLWVRSRCPAPGRLPRAQAGGRVRRGCHGVAAASGPGRDAVGLQLLCDRWVALGLPPACDCNRQVSVATGPAAMLSSVRLDRQFPRAARTPGVQTGNQERYLGV